MMAYFIFPTEQCNAYMSAARHANCGCCHFTQIAGLLFILSAPAAQLNRPSACLCGSTSTNDMIDYLAESL